MAASSFSKNDGRRTREDGRVQSRARSRRGLDGWRYPIAFLAALTGLWTLTATAIAGGSGGGGSPTVQITECSPGQTSTTSCQQSSTSLQAAQPSGGSKTGTGQSAQTAPPGSEVHTYSLKTGRGTVTTASGQHITDKATVQVVAPTAAPAPAKSRPKLPKLPGATAPLSVPQPPVTTTGGSGFAGLGGAFGSLSLISSDQALSQFQIPPFLMPIYLAAGRAYDVPWQVLASINRIESDFGRDLSTSTAGAVGWMQFMPETWRTYAVDANGDGYADPYDPADAIFAAARYLHDAGASTSLPNAVFAYNHATWYVDEVLQTANVYGSLPPGLVSETGSLAYGRFPLLGPVAYGDSFVAAQHSGHGAVPLQIQGKGGATAVATQQAKVSRILLDPALSAELRGGGVLPSVAATYSEPGPAATTGGALEPVISTIDGVLNRASSFLQRLTGLSLPAFGTSARPAAASIPAVTTPPQHIRAGLPPGFGVARTAGITVVLTDPQGDQYSYGGLDALPAYVRPGAVVAGGRAIGTLPQGSNATLDFSITAAGGVPVDPRPLIDGYRLQEAIHFYRAVAPFGANPFVPQPASASYGGYVSPFAGYTPTAERIDMGVDYSAPPGSPLVAIGPGRVIGLSPNWYAGQPFVDYQITSGPLAGVYVYYAEQLVPSVSAGQTVAAGQVIARVAASGTGLELGFGTGVPGQTLAQVSGGYAEGALTTAGQAFSNLMLALGAPAGLAEGRTPVGLTSGLPSLSGVKADPAPRVEAVTAQPASRAQEAAISQALDRISNPKLAKPSPYAIRVPNGHAASASGHSPPALAVEPTAAGARLQAVTVPSNAPGSSAWAIGTVDGTLRPGWARSQTVLLRFADGSWSVVGPPRDRNGRVVNPRLHAIAVNADGSGYAVGEHGSLVRFGAGERPVLLPAPSSTALSAVVASGSASRPSGVAVGERGAIVELAGDAATALPRPAGRPSLTAVAADRAGAVVAGNGTGPVLYRVAGSSVSSIPVQLKLPAGTQSAVTSVAERSGSIWLAGAMIDSNAAGAQSPLALRQVGAGWKTFCDSGPELAGAVEVGTPTPSACDGTLPPGAGAGPASAIALAPQGAVLGTAGGLLLQAGPSSSFTSLCATSCSSPQQPMTNLALGRDGAGWAVGSGALSRVVSSSSRQLPTSLPTAAPLAPAGASSGPATVVAPLPGGDRVLAASAGTATMLAAGHRDGVKPPGVALRRLALLGPGQGWGISQTGGLVRYRDGRWSAQGGVSLQRIADVSSRLGNAPLSSTDQPLGSGLNAVSFDPSGAGWAVGGHGLILHYSGGAWRSDPAGSSATLTDVAAGSGGAIAVGDHGTLLERGSDGWKPSEEAQSLVGGQDFSRAVALDDGTMVALAGGSLIVRDPGQPNWGAAPVPPLGTTPLRVAAYRDFAGALHVLALVTASGAQALLDGDSTGWHPLDLPTGLDVADLAVDQAGHHMWLAGQQNGAPATAELPLTGDVIPSSLSGPPQARAPVGASARVPSIGPSDLARAVSL